MSASAAKQIDSELSNLGGRGREIFSRNKSILPSIAASSKKTQLEFVCLSDNPYKISLLQQVCSDAAVHGFIAGFHLVT